MPQIKQGNVIPLSPPQNWPTWEDFPKHPRYLLPNEPGPETERCGSALSPPDDYWKLSSDEASLHQAFADTRRTKGKPFRFLSLPAELRERVYEYHFAAFDLPLKWAAPPPITRVNRSLREETHALFFQQCEFEVEIFPAAEWTEDDEQLRAVGCHTEKMLMFTPANNLALIRKLRLDVPMWFGYDFGFLEAKWELNLKKNTLELVQFDSSPLAGIDGMAFNPARDAQAEAEEIWLDMREEVENALRQFLEAIKSRTDMPNALRKEDVLALVEIFGKYPCSEGACRSYCESVGVEYEHPSESTVEFRENLKAVLKGIGGGEDDEDEDYEEWEGIMDEDEDDQD